MLQPVKARVPIHVDSPASTWRHECGRKRLAQRRQQLCAATRERVGLGYRGTWLPFLLLLFTCVLHCKFPAHHCLSYGGSFTVQKGNSAWAISKYMKNKKSWKHIGWAQKWPLALMPLALVPPHGPPKAWFWMSPRGSPRGVRSFVQSSGFKLSDPGALNSSMHTFPEKTYGFAMVEHIFLYIWIWDLRPSTWISWNCN